MREASSKASSKETRPDLEEGKGRGLSIFSLEPAFLDAVSLSCPAFPLQPSLSAPLLNLGILVYSSVNSINLSLNIYLPALATSPILVWFNFGSYYYLKPAYVRPNMIFKLSKFSPFDC